MFFLGEEQDSRNCHLFQKQREKYGFDERETWDLSLPFMLAELKKILLDYNKAFEDGSGNILELFVKCFDLLWW